MFKALTIMSLVLVIFISSCNKTEKVQPVQKAGDLEMLLGYMVGSFSSDEQAKSDSDFYNIHLGMVQIWNERTDGYWLYIEQAAATALEKPYRQRLYNIFKNEDGSFQSDVYTFAEPMNFAGAWKTPASFDSLSFDSISLREGCSIIMVKEKSGLFIGGTMGTECSSTLAGASYATSQVKIGPDEIYSWDQGFDSEGVQVWGAEKSGYIFKRIE